ncbi:ankyrin repeat domain-containing protein [Vibrio penaeicida]|uniref:ankyrin repeat domain-containing protein n=1 Tax=Vibrio penaeicida TaxID=104609 RepID=UPI000CE9C942|nr:ankyrin repeat domain-containing protein [Vibrio penaeicida]
MNSIDSPKFKLFQSLKRGKIEEARRWINDGCDILAVTEKEKWTYLHKSLQSTNKQVPHETIQFLIDQGLDVNAIDSYGYTPLMYAVRQRNVEGMRLLLENGADKLIEHRDQKGVNALRLAIKGKPFIFEVVKTLLDAKADPDSRSDDNAKSFREIVNFLDDMPSDIIELLSQY